MNNTYVFRVLRRDSLFYHEFDVIRIALVTTPLGRLRFRRKGWCLLKVLFTTLFVVVISTTLGK